MDLDELRILLGGLLTLLTFIRLLKTDFLLFLNVCARCKYHRLKYGTELEQGDMVPPKFEKELRGMLCLLFSLLLY